MNNKLYVGNLPFSMSDESLTEVFASHGQVQSAKIITDRQSGRSKGFGFVEMASEEDANKAIEALHGQNVEGRNIVVNVARPQEDRPRRSFDGPRGGGRSGGGFRGGSGGGGSRGPRSSRYDDSSDQD